VANAVTSGNRDAGKPRSPRQRYRLARQCETAIGKRDRFDPRRRGLELGLAGKRIRRRHRQSADARVGGRGIAPVDRSKNRPALLAGTDANAQHGAAVLRGHARETAVFEACGGGVIGMNIDLRFGRMRAQPRRLPGARHGVPLIAQASGIEAKRKSFTGRGAKLRKFRRDEATAPIAGEKSAV